MRFFFWGGGRGKEKIDEKFRAKTILKETVNLLIDSKGFEG